MNDFEVLCDRLRFRCWEHGHEEVFRDKIPPFEIVRKLFCSFEDVISLTHRDYQCLKSVDASQIFLSYQLSICLFDGAAIVATHAAQPDLVYRARRAVAATVEVLKDLDNRFRDPESVKVRNNLIARQRNSLNPLLFDYLEVMEDSAGFWHPAGNWDEALKALPKRQLNLSNSQSDPQSTIRIGPYKRRDLTWTVAALLTSVIFASCAGFFGLIIDHWDAGARALILMLVAIAIGVPLFRWLELILRPREVVAFSKDNVTFATYWRKFSEVDWSDLANGDIELDFDQSSRQSNGSETRIVLQRTFVDNRFQSAEHFIRVRPDTWVNIVYSVALVSYKLKQLEQTNNVAPVVPSPVSLQRPGVLALTWEAKYRAETYESHAAQLVTSTSQDAYWMILES